MKNRSRFFAAAAALLIGPAVVAILIFETPAQSADIPYSGQVVKTDAAEHNVIVKNPESGGRIKFVVTNGTAITSGNDKKGLGDIKPGEAVEIEYALEGGKYIAHKIMLKPSGGK
ncbi:MAG TPA: hypothetical protein VFH55_06230 [Nitrospiria bacterium]|nr:hypothetical protein [Nitrospiria bacterium]